MDSGKFKLKVHLATLAMLLVYKPPKVPDPQHKVVYHERVLVYIIAACRKKIYHRISHPALSMPYMDSLKAVKVVAFDQALTAQRAAAPIDHSIQKAEWESDKIFLSSIVINSNGIDIPQLLLFFNAVAKGTQDISGLYSAATRQEFHDVFVALLTKFLENLRHLCNITQPPKGDPKPPKGTRPAGVPAKATKRIHDRLKTALNVTSTASSLAASEDSPRENKPASSPTSLVTAEVTDCLTLLMRTGSLLFRLAHGSALRLHLQAIETALKSHHQEVVTKLDPSTRRMGTSDEDLQAVQIGAVENGAPLPLWKAYRDWVRLCFIHFKSCETVSGYFVVHPGTKPIDIRLVAVPEDRDLDKLSMPWAELIASSHFPATATDKLSPVKTNAEILEFLTNGLAMAPKKRDVDHAKISDKTNSKVLGELCHYLSTIALELIPQEDKSTGRTDIYGWGKQCKEILQLLLPGDLSDEN